MFDLFAQLFRFGIVGVTAAAIHFCVVVMLVQMLAYAPLVANIIAFFISFQASYYGHRRFTFAESAVLHSAALPKLLMVQLINLAANESLFYFFLSLHLPYQLALLIVLTILPMLTFIVSKLWIFR